MDAHRLQRGENTGPQASLIEIQVGLAVMQGEVIGTAHTASMEAVEAK
jgi:hypothetical protein